MPIANLLFQQVWTRGCQNISMKKARVTQNEGCVIPLDSLFNSVAGVGDHLYVLCKPEAKIMSKSKHQI